MSILDGINPIQCPSCYRHGKETSLEPKLASLPRYNSTATDEIIYFACTCGYTTTNDALLFHEYRVKYNQLLDLLIHIRGWVASSYNSTDGKLFVIKSAVEHYFGTPK